MILVGPSARGLLTMPLRMTGLIRRLRYLAKPAVTDSDADLLSRFARVRDESAFAALVARYGPMVFAVCRRVLRDAHAAEDASQATFLVLARRAGSIERPDSLAGWLYGVAYRVALKARPRSRPEPILSSDRADRQHDLLSEVSARELLEILEEELQRLPEALRLSVVLCCLEGLSQEEAAQRLGCTAGSIRGRLERGRKRLHERLVRRGLTLPATMATVEASRGVASAALAGKIVQGAMAFASGGRGVVSQQVIALAEGGLRAMFWTKMKVVLVVLVASGLVGTGTSWLAIGPGQGDPVNIARAAGAEPKPIERKEKLGPKENADATEQAERMRIAVRLEQARALVLDLAERTKRENALSEKIIEERQSLVSLEEQLREEEADARENRTPSEVENGISKEVARLEAEIFTVERNPSNIPVVQRLQKQVDVATQRLKTWKDKRQAVRKKGAERLVELRRSIVRKEESIRQLERNRELLRNEMDRRSESGAVAEAPLGVPKAVLQRLDAIQRELTELRRELRGRKGGKE